METRAVAEGEEGDEEEEGMRTRAVVVGRMSRFGGGGFSGAEGERGYKAVMTASGERDIA